MLKPCKVCKRQPKIWKFITAYGDKYFAKCACDNEYYKYPNYLFGNNIHTNERLFEYKFEAIKFWNAHR